MKACIFNSGLGNRMGDFTKNNHKSMAPLKNGETIFHRQIRILKEEGITDFIINAIDNTYEIVNSSGVQILIFLSALQNISDSIYESARVEGATKWEEFWKITFPMLTPMILVNIVYTIIDSFINPRYQILEYIENNSFVDNQMGYASALSWIYFAVTLVIVGVLWKIISKRVQYLD